MKRLIDVCLATVGLIIAAPIMALTSLALLVTLGRPLLHRQQRPGLHGALFWLLKFRTMSEETDEAGKLLPDERRLTRIGVLLRSLSVDELPELLNVLRGDMSLVGPRPLLADYLPLYTDEEMRRHEVQPGITGWAQVNGRNLTSWEERLKLDVWYVDNRSLWLDLKILAMTAVVVARRSGISHAGEATMPRFEGTQQALRNSDTRT